MRTIYFYGIDNNIGGMEVYAFNLIKNVLSKTDEFKFHIISQFEDFSFKKELVEDLGCSYTIVPKRKKHPFKYLKAIKKILKNSNKEDFLQLNIMSYRNIFLFHAVKKSKIKTILVGHSTNTDNKLNYLVHKIGKLFYSNLGLLVANNKKIIDYFSLKKSTNYKIIEIGIDKSKYQFNKETRIKIRKLFNVSDNDFVIGQIGRVCKTKNQIFSCKLIKKLNNENIKLFIFGKVLNKKAIDYGNKNKLSNIKFMGEVNNINEIYNALDLFILPSKHESAGFVLYEALENGCPSIISDNVPTDGITSGNLFIKELNMHEWKNEIEHLVKFPLQRNNKNITPSIEDEIKKYIDLYKSI